MDQPHIDHGSLIHDQEPCLQRFPFPVFLRFRITVKSQNAVERLCFIDPRCLRHTPARLTCGRSEYDLLLRIELTVHFDHCFQNRSLAGAGAACDNGQVMPEHHLHAF